MGIHQVFVDATQQSQSPYVDRARKSDRLPSFKTVSPEPALLPHCEPLASPFADPILGNVPALMSVLVPVPVKQTASPLPIVTNGIACNRGVHPLGRPEGDGKFKRAGLVVQAVPRAPARYLHRRATITSR
jgi:hypothetical protein